jgi:hypothetical protein
MKARRHLVRIVFLVLGAALAMAIVAAGFASASEDRAGTTTSNFLSLGAGPRILGMGGATLAMGSDLAAGSWNPAALGWMDQGAVMISHSGLDNASLQEWVAVGGKVGGFGTRWAISGLYQGDGSFEGRDASNNSTGNFAVTNFAAGAQLAQQIGSRLTVGLGLKTVIEKLDDVSGIGTTYDGGVQYHEGIFSAGLAFQNQGGHMAYDGGRAIYPFPGNYGVGLAVVHPGTGLSFAVDANFPYAYANDVRAGLEWRWKDMVALRAGYRHEMTDVADDPLSGPTFGLGAGANGFWFDYGYLLSGNAQEGQHRVALTFYPGRWAGLGGDPYGQGEIPNDFDGKPVKKIPLIGPPVPPDLKKKGK